jgi:TatD DNase family protein
MIDTHVHLQLSQYNDDLVAVLDRAAAAGVHTAIVPGTKLKDSVAAAGLAATYRDAACSLYATVGIHPTSAQMLTDDVLKTLADLATEQRVVAIGEIGLDYYWPKRKNRGWYCAPPEVQRCALRHQLALAAQLDLPVVVHDRDAHEDTLEILSAWRMSNPRARGVLHSYAGGPEMLQDVLDLGFYVGMDGPVTFRRAQDLHEVARVVPLDRLLLETDGPYLTPAPHRGRRNEPAYIPLIVTRIAELKGLAVRQIAEATTANARALFGLLQK